MLGGIAKLYIANLSNVNTSGFSCNGKRFEFSLKNGIDWLELNIQRDSAIDSGKFDNGNEIETSFNIIDADTSINSFIGKRVVIKYVTPDGEIRIVNPDKGLMLNASFDSGVKPGDNFGMVVKLIGDSKICPEILMSYTPPEPPIVESSLKVHLRADDVVLDGSNITLMNDKTGNGYNGFVSTGRSNPLLISNALNGKPAVDLILNSVLEIASNYFGNTSLWGGGVNSLNINDECTVVIVAKHNDLASNKIRVFNNKNIEFDFYQYGGVDYLRISNRGNIQVFQGTENTHNSDFHIWTITNKQHTENIYKDGVLFYSTSNWTYSEKQGNLFINNYDSIGGKTGKMVMPEFRIYDKVLTTEELSDLHDELKTYYGL